MDKNNDDAVCGLRIDGESGVDDSMTDEQWRHATLADLPEDRRRALLAYMRQRYGLVFPGLDD